MNGSVIIFCLV